MKLISKIVGVTLGLAMAVGVGVGVAANNRKATGLNAAPSVGTTTYSLLFEDMGEEGWDSNYSARQYVATDGVTISMASANKNTQTITDRPVTKGQPIELKLPSNPGVYISAFTFNALQWGSKAQTMTAHYSTNSGSSYTSTGVTSSNFSITVSDLSEGTNAVKITFSSSSNQVGLTSFVVTYSASTGPEKTATATTVSASGSKTLLDSTADPADTVQLNAAVTYNSGANSISNPEIEWSGDNDSVATIDSNGLVTAVSVGKAKFTASYAGDSTYNSSADEISIFVVNPNEVVFNFKDLSEAYSWENGSAYTPVSFAGVSISTNSGGNNAKFYITDFSWRMYNGGALTITPPSGKSITAVSSAPSHTFSISNDGSNATASFNAQVNFTSITVSLGEERVLNSISASLTNGSKVWRVNDVVSASDLTVVPHYNNGDGEAITDGTGVTVTNGTLSVAGSNTVNVSYGGKSTTLNVNALSSTVVAWDISGSIGDTVKSTNYDLSGLTLHAYYDNGKTDEASSSVAALYEMIAEPATAGDTPDPNNKITVKIYLKTDTGHTNCLETISNVPAPIINSPKGSEDNPYNVVEAKAAIDAGTGITDVYARGIICKIDSYDSSSKSITYWISDDGTTGNRLEAYKGKGLFGTDFASTDDIELGATVTIRGNLTKYNTTYEFSAGSEQVSYQAPTTADKINSKLKAASSKAFINGQENRTSDVSPESIVFADLGLSNSVEYATSFGDEHFTITFSAGNKYYNTGSAMRVYEKCSFTIASEETITKIAFTWDGSNKPGSNVASVGTYDSSEYEWTGSATSITFSNPEGSAHWRLKSLVVTYGTFESVSDIKLRFGASIPVTAWEAINDLENVEITGYGVALFRTTAALKNTAPSVQSLFNAEPDKANPVHVAINVRNSNVPPAAEDGNYTFVSRVNITKVANYDMYFCAQAFIVVNGEDYYFIGEEMRESVRTLAASNDGTNLSSEALASLLS